MLRRRSTRSARLIFQGRSTGPLRQSFLDLFHGPWGPYAHRTWQGVLASSVTRKRAATMSLAAMSLARLPLVTLSRTGRSFPVNQGEAILDAALRREIWLPHACRGGTCGSCKAVIVAGDVTYDESSPLRTRQAAGRSEAYLCCARPVGDVTLDVAELPARPIGAGVSYRRPARIAALVKVSRDVAIVTLKPPPNAAIHHRAGQYISLIGDDGRSHAFSIANAPRPDGK